MALGTGLKAFIMEINALHPFFLPVQPLTPPPWGMDLPQPLGSLIPLFQALVQLGLQGLILLPKLLAQGLQGREVDEGKEVARSQ